MDKNKAIVTRYSSRLVRAFTLVELLVVIAIIGVLVALLLPAVQAAREAARRSQCQNHLKQIGLGALNFESTYNHFPSGGWGPGWVGDPNRGFGPDQPGSWSYNLLPFIEQANVRDLGSGLTGTAFEEALVIANQTPIATFNCPSRRTASIYPARWYTIRNAPAGLLLNAAREEGVVKSDYAASAGDATVTDASPGGVMWQPQDYTEAESPPANPTPDTWWTPTDFCDKPPLGPQMVTYSHCQSGIMYYHSKLEIRRITDGLSNTYLAGEKYVRPEAYEGTTDQSSSAWSWGENQSMYAGFDWDNQRAAWNPDFFTAPSISEPKPDTPGVPCNLFACRRFGGAHVAVFYMAFADGSVHGIQYGIDDLVHRNLANRLDGQIVDLNDL